MDYQQYFEYPIQTAMLLSKKSKIKKSLREHLEKPIKKKIAILGGSTTNEVVAQLELFLLRQGIEAEFYQSEYNQFWQDAVFGNETLDSFKPDIIYIHTNWRNITDFPKISNSEAEILELYDTVCKHFEVAWEALRNKFGCVIIQNNFERPNYRLMGNRDVWDIHGRSNFICRLNQYFYQYAREHNNFYINDIDCLSAEFGLTNWNDSFCWYMYKYAISLNAIPLLANSVCNIIKSVYGRNKKALVLDLDNTLWGGVIADDSLNGISIGQETPEGQAFYAFQTYCRELKENGVILAINSKNDEENAITGLNHPDGVLKPDDFVCIKANWNSKDVNIREIAGEINISTDSLVFIDDNPAEREIVKAQVPDVSVPQVEDAEHFIEVIDRNGFFEATAISAEDLRKTEMYHAEISRKKQQSAFSDYGEYLDSLEMRADIKPFDDISLSRIAQLTNKSNQFNLTTLRCSQEDINAMKENGEYITLQGNLVDKFGDNGIVSIVAGEVLGDVCHIRLWLMSCRVLKRGMEDVMMQRFIDLVKQRGIKRVIGYYYPTAKNAMVKEFYKSYGFRLTECDEKQNAVWELNTDDFQNNQIHIQII